MILYCDTSALLKLYVQESGSAEVCAHAHEARALAVVRIAWAEAYAALARKAREAPACAHELEQVRARLRTDWAQFAVLEVTQELVQLAGELADAFALRAYDSVQLAAARILQGATSEPLCFACFDQRLNQAARLLGLSTLGKP